MKRQIYKNAEDIFVKKNNIKIIQTIAVLCTAALVCGCSIRPADQSSVAEAVNETSVSDVADAADSESWENDTADPPMRKKHWMQLKLKSADLMHCSPFPVKAAIFIG